MSATAKQQILLVDDEPQILVALEDLLSDRFVVYTAESGEDALQLMEHEENIAVVVTDQRMPKMAGDELVSRMDFHRAQRIIVTGYADLNAVVRAVNEGHIYAYVTKPWNAEDLRLKVTHAAEQFRLTQELENEKRLLNDLMNNSPDGIYFKDRELRFIRANNTIARWLGKDIAEVVGKTLSELRGSDSSIHDIEERERAILKSGVPILDAVRKESRLGSDVWLSEMKAPVHSAEHETVGLIGISRDITRQRELEEQLVQSQKMEAIGRLAGGVAHDFNNLLVVIQSYGELLKDGFEASDPRKEEAEELLKASERAAGLTRQLLTFSRQRPAKTALLHVNDILSDVVKMLRRLVHASINVELELAERLETVRGDATQIEQVVLNLAINARDAMPEGGRLVLRTELVELPTGSATAEKRPWVSLSVRDTGVGMAPEIRSRIFEPFFTTKEVGRGTGLGLSTVYGIVRQLGGDIQVDSTLGSGTCFTVLLPVSTQKDQQATPRRPDVPSSTGTETILVVEDDEAVRRVATHILKQNGYQVLEAALPSQAKRLVAEHPGAIDLLLTDFVLPEMDGSALAQELVQARPTLRVLYMSGYADGAPKQTDLNTLGNQYVEKPFNPARLLHAVRAALSEQ